VNRGEEITPVFTVSRILSRTQKFLLVRGSKEEGPPKYATIAKANIEEGKIIIRELDSN